MRDLAHFAHVLGVPSPGEVPVRRVVVDSRQVEAGDLFVALPGSRHDGHEFLDDARARGAVAVLVSRPYEALPALVVPDTREALWQLARWWRGHLTGHVLAVTGTAGKTTAKELLRHVLAPAGPVYASPASYNSTIGLPLSILNTPLEARVAIYELGINRPGEMTLLGDLTRPEDLVLTALGPAHLEFFSSYRHYLEEKLSILRHLPPGGRVFHPPFDGDEARVFRELFPAGLIDVETPPLEEAWQETHSARILGGLVLAVARALGMEEAEVRERIRSFPGVWGRKTPVDLEGSRWIHDAYNANPLSVQDLLLSFQDRARIAALVLGDMLELGGEAERWHRWVGREAARLGYRNLLAVGEKARWIAEEAAAHGVPAQWFPSVDALIQEALDDLLAAPLVLLKASNAMGFERILEAARARRTSRPSSG